MKAQTQEALKMVIDVLTQEEHVLGLSAEMEQALNCCKEALDENKKPHYIYLFQGNNGEPIFFWNKTKFLKSDLIYQGRIKLDINYEVD